MRILTINFLKRIEDFKQSYNKAVNELDEFKEILLNKKTIRPADTEDIFATNATKHKEMQNILKHVTKNGKKILSNSCKNDCHFKGKQKQTNKKKGKMSQNNQNLFYFHVSRFHSTIYRKKNVNVASDLSKTYIAFRDFFLSFAYGTKLMQKKQTNTIICTLEA